MYNENCNKTYISRAVKFKFDDAYTVLLLTTYKVSPDFPNYKATRNLDPEMPSIKEVMLLAEEKSLLFG